MIDGNNNMANILNNLENTMNNTDEVQIYEFQAIEKFGIQTD